MIVRETWCVNCQQHLAPEQFRPAMLRVKGNKRRCKRCESEQREAKKASKRRARA